MTLVLTGFEPFGGRAINRSWQAVERVALRTGWERVRLPVVYARIAELVPALVEKAPRAVLLVGEANRDVVTLERLAHNACSAERADSAGEHRERVHDSGHDELVATWDLAGALAAARRFVPAEISDDAGGYVCNAALYHALRTAASGTRVGFVHVPVAPTPGVDELALALAAIGEAMLA